jgi:hypothetical protein
MTPVGLTMRLKPRNQERSNGDTIKTPSSADHQ